MSRGAAGGAGAAGGPDDATGRDAATGCGADTGPDAATGRGVAAALLDALVARGWTVAAAESLTGGLVVATLVDVPGASRAVRGGVVAYATDVKGAVLGVDPGLLASRGAVDPEVARQMATGVRAVLRADVGLATTGVAGPDPQDGHPPGTVHVAVATPDGVRTRTLALSGDRAAIRSATVAAVLAEALAALGAPPRGDAGTPGASAAL